MGFLGDAEGWRLARVAALAFGCAALANCSGGLSGKLDPRYGVEASARVIPPGETVPKGGGVYRVGQPYVVGGRIYVPHEDPHYHAVGLASWYGDDFRGRYTANGEIFDENAISAAHPTLPLPCYVRVTNLENRRSIIVRVNDRGPYVENRLIDVSVRTAKLLGFYGEGVTKVRVDYVGRAPLAGSDDRNLAATLRENVPATGIQVASTKPFIPAVFDKRPLRQIAANVPAPPERPYSFGGDQLAAAPQPAPNVELAAAERPAPIHRAPVLAASPISAYAPARYDGGAVLSGRGLY